MGEMNVRTLKKSVVFPALCLAGTGLLSACAFNPATDPTSPLSAHVEQLVEAHQQYPSLANYPAAPVDLPTTDSLRLAVETLKNSEDVLEQQVASIDWQFTETPEVTAAQIRQLLADMPVVPPTADTPAEIEAFAQSLRDRAKAPPPVDRPLR